MRFYFYHSDEYKEAIIIKLPIFCKTSSTETEDVNVE